MIEIRETLLDGTLWTIRSILAIGLVFHFSCSDGQTANQRSHSSLQPQKAMLSLSKNIRIELVYVPDGEFVMGSTDRECDRSENEGPQRKIHVNGFYLGVTEITQAQWKAVMNSEPWKDQKYVRSGDSFPASYISWYDTQQFCKLLSRKTGAIVRLPSEAEWEYACRAGTNTAFYFGDDEGVANQYGWVRTNTKDLGEEYPHEVGKKKPNKWGLHDMCGNVEEWCEGPFMEYLTGIHGDMTNVTRGGNWYSCLRYCRSAARCPLVGKAKISAIGFRIAAAL